MHQATNSFPMGVERVLYAAATDEAFRALLFSDRSAALAGRHPRLNDTEHAMLLAIPDDQLAAAIDALDLRPGNVKRRAVLAAVATSAAGLVTLGAASGCLTGTRPEDDLHRDGGPHDGGPHDSGPHDSGHNDGGPPNQDADPDDGPATVDQIPGE